MDPRLGGRYIRIVVTPPVPSLVVRLRSTPGSPCRASVKTETMPIHGVLDLRKGTAGLCLYVSPRPLRHCQR
jgi:hypothetical protein